MMNNTRRACAALIAVLVLGMAGSGWAQGLQTGIISGTITTNDGLSLPGATVTVTSPALQGARTTVTDVNGNYVIRGLPPGDYSVTLELSGMATRTEHTVVALGRTTTVVDGVMTVATVTEAVTVVAEATPVAQQPGRRRELPQERSGLAADRPDAADDRRALARPDRQHAQRRPADDLRRLRLRQRVPDRRRGRQRQHLRDRERPVHRGRDRRDAGAHVGHLGRIRPLLRRRRQPRHQARRQPLLGQLSPQPHEPVVGGRDAVRDHRAARRSAVRARGHARRTDHARSAVVLHVRPQGEDGDAVQLRRHRHFPARPAWTKSATTSSSPAPSRTTTPSRAAS